MGDDPVIKVGCTLRDFMDQSRGTRSFAIEKRRGFGEIAHPAWTDPGQHVGRNNAGREPDFYLRNTKFRFCFGDHHIRAGNQPQSSSDYGAF